MKTAGKGIAIIFILILPFSRLFAGDAIITHLALQKYIKVGVNISITGWVENVSGSNITSFKTCWRLDNGSTNMSTTINIGGGGLAPGGYYLPFTHPVALNVSSSGPHVFEIWVVATGETNYSNDTITINFTALSSYANKINLFEEYTATWCQYCPAGNSAANSIASLQRTAVAKFHNSDAYSFAIGETYYEAYYSGSIFTPGGMFNMGESGNYSVNSGSNTWLSEMNSRSNSISPLELSISPSLNITSRQLDVDLTAKFKYVESGDYYMNVYILENGISGTQTGASGTYIHNHVVRAMLGGSSGSAGIIPNTPVLNSNYTKNYSFTIPSGWDLDKLALIGLVFRKDGSLTDALNAVNYSYDNSGVEPVLATSNSFAIYPNPAIDIITIENTARSKRAIVSIYNIEGKLLLSQTLTLERTEMDISNFSRGLYIMKVKSDDGIYFMRFGKQ
ncbi:MAG: Omp28-related outer membrane protein [Bacteroidetes bacterium]|nr:Omp28-related outer membrane protein [Bacteroidota bacterium]MBU1718197.1 Omp28-related outer membrane protein [Bacteroidota bacterium]